MDLNLFIEKRDLNLLTWNIKLILLKQKMLAGFKRALSTFQMVRLEDPDKQNILDRFKLSFVLFFNGFILFNFNYLIFIISILKFHFIIDL